MAFFIFSKRYHTIPYGTVNSSKIITEGWTTGETEEARAVSTYVLQGRVAG